MLLHGQTQVGLTGNIREKLDGRGVDHHNSDCHEGVKGGLRISRNDKSRQKDEGV